MAESIIFEAAMNAIGLGFSFLIGRFAYAGYSSVGSPTLLRLTVAFASISIGFIIFLSALFISPGELTQIMVTAGLSLQAVGYFFIAFSHSIKSFDFAKSGKPMMSLIFLPVIAFQSFSIIIPGNSIEHLVRSISFILLVYVSIETMASYMQNRRRSTLLMGTGLGMLALAELMAWYNFIFPGSLFYYFAITVKIAGFGMMFIPFSRLGLMSGMGRMNPQVGNGV